MTVGVIGMGCVGLPLAVAFAAEGRDVAALADCDAVLICVPTPLTVNREPDLGPLVGAACSLSEVLQAGQLVVIESTTYPGSAQPGGGSTAPSCPGSAAPSGRARP